MPGELSDLLKLWDRSDVLDAIASDGVAGLPDVARPATVAGLAERVSPLLVVLPRSRDAEAFAAALGPWMAGGRVELFPAWEVLPGEAGGSHPAGAGTGGWRRGCIHIRGCRVL